MIVAGNCSPEALRDQGMTATENAADPRLVLAVDAVIARYNTEVFKRDMARSVASAVDRDQAAQVSLVRDTVVAEVPVPDRFVSRTLRDLDIRGKFGVSVLMVKRDAAGGERVNEAPSADYAFQPGDVMLVMGPGDRVRAAGPATPLAA